MNTIFKQVEKNIDYLVENNAGLIDCGFVINGYVECQLEDITELHFMTRAIKSV